MGRDLDPDEELKVEGPATFAERARSMVLRYSARASDATFQLSHRTSALETAQRVIALVEPRDAKLAGELTSMLSAPTRSLNDFGNFVQEGVAGIHSRW